MAFLGLHDRASRHFAVRMSIGGRMPTLYVPHGAGPCFFMEWNPAGTWDRMIMFLWGIGASLPQKPEAILVVSAHWEAPAPTVMASAAPPLLFDYQGFPDFTYRLSWPAPGSPILAARVMSLLSAAGLDCASDASRGFDHGAFVPLKVAFPSAEIPTVQLSLQQNLDASEHLALGRALAPLRDEGVLIIGSGMSYHNPRGANTRPGHDDSIRFDDWLGVAIAKDAASRNAALAAWKDAPSARASHPSAEHLLPLMVAAGAAGDDLGSTVYRDEVMGVRVSAIRFG